MKIYQLQPCIFAMLGVTTTYHGFVGGEYIKLIRTEEEAEFPLGIAVEMAHVYIGGERMSYDVMAIYQKHNFDPVVALEGCWPDKEVSVWMDFREHDPIQLKVRVSGNLDDIYEEGDLKGPYLYDPYEVYEDPDNVSNYFRAMTLNGEFGPCWKVDHRFKLHLSTAKTAHFPSAWKIKRRKVIDTKRILLDPVSYFDHACVGKGIFTYVISDEGEMISVGDKSAALGGPGLFETEFINDDELYHSTKFHGVLTFVGFKFSLRDRPLLPHHDMYSLLSSLGRRFTAEHGLDKSIPVTITIYSEPEMEFNLPTDSVINQDNRFLFHAYAGDNWVLPFSFFKRCTIIVHQNVRNRKYKFICPNEMATKKKKSNECRPPRPSIKDDDTRCDLRVASE